MVTHDDIKWQDVEGWFFEEDAKVYDIIVGSGARRIVEVGCYLGRSTCALLEAIRRKTGSYDIHVVDTFKGSPDEPQHLAAVKKHGGSLLLDFLSNIAQYKTLVNVHYGDSVAMSRDFAERSVDACFIDASHAENDLRRDLLAWHAKVKTGGILAGHDYTTWTSVRKVVDEWFPQVLIVGTCWMTRVE